MKRFVQVEGKAKQESFRGKNKKTQSKVFFCPAREPWIGYRSPVCRLTPTEPAVPLEARQAGAGEGGAPGGAAQRSLGGIAVVASPLAGIRRALLLCGATRSVRSKVKGTQETSG